MSEKSLENEYYSINNQEKVLTDAPQRKKLLLKPRSVPKISDCEIVRPQHGCLVNKGNPFGSALPREEVLQRRGINPALQDARIEKKAEIPHYTPKQEHILETIREELSKITNDLREANEMELPEESFRVAEEQKKQELNDTIERFKLENTVVTVGAVVADETNSESGTSSRLRRSGSEPIKAYDTPNRFSGARSPTHCIKTRVNETALHLSWRTTSCSTGTSDQINIDRRHDDHSDSSLDQSIGGLGAPDHQFISFSTNRRRRRSGIKSELQSQRI